MQLLQTFLKRILHNGLRLNLQPNVVFFMSNSRVHTTHLVYLKMILVILKRI